MKYLTVRKKKTLDNVTIGLVGGLIVPFLTLSIFYLIKYYPETSFKYFFTQLYSIDMLSKLMSLCAIPNLLLFFIFLWTNRNQSAKGVIIATLLLVVVVLIFKTL